MSSIPVLIIPVLNRYDLLDEALQSIDYPIDNILIINNGLEKYDPDFSNLNLKIWLCSQKKPFPLS